MFQKLGISSAVTYFSVYRTTREKQTEVKKNFSFHNYYQNG